MHKQLTLERDLNIGYSKMSKSNLRKLFITNIIFTDLQEVRCTNSPGGYGELAGSRYDNSHPQLLSYSEKLYNVQTGEAP